MPAIYKGLTLNPIQSVSISEQTEFLSSGKLKKYLFNISVKGKIVAPQNLSITAKHNYILSQQSAIISAYSVSGTNSSDYFEVQPRNGSGSFRCVPRIKSVNFEEGVWVDFSDFTIEMEADSFIFNGVKVPATDELNLDLDESWSVEINDEDKRFRKVTHRISAKCKDTSQQAGWQKAKAAVDSKINATIPNDIASASGATLQNPHNRKKTYKLNKLNGEVSADIEVSYHSPLGSPSASYATHEQTRSEKQGSDSARKTFSVEGTVTGLAALGSTNRYSPANSLWSTIKASIEAEYSAKIISSSSETHDQVKGTISYSYEIEDYNKPSDGLKSKRVTITEMGALANPPKLYVLHQTITGGGGPLFQDIGTKKIKTKTVVIDAVASSDVNLDTLQYQPTGSIIESDSVQRNLAVGKKTRTTTFIWVE